MPAVALHCSSVTFKNEGMLFLIESTDNGKYRLLHSQTPHFKDTWLCDNSRYGINLAIPGSNGQTKKTLLKIFLDASFFYYKSHITRLFCSLNWNRQTFMASQTLCLFGFVVHPAPVFMHTGGSYHLAKPNRPGKNQWNYHEKMVKRTTTTTWITLAGKFHANRGVSLISPPKFWHSGKLP